MSVLRRIPALFVALLLLATATSRVSAQYATPIAIRGQATPETGNNQFSEFERPVINNIGQVAFEAFMSSPTNGIFLTLPQLGTGPQLPGSTLLNNLSTVALHSGPLPQSTFDGTTGDQFFPFFNGFGNEVALNDVPATGATSVTTRIGTTFSGQIAFQANVSQSSGVSLSGIFAGLPPAPGGPNMLNVAVASSVNVSGTNPLVPPFPAGTTWSALDFLPSQNNLNHVVFSGDVSSGQSGIFYWTPSSPNTYLTVAVTNQAAPGTTGTFQGFGTNRALSFNNNDILTYFATTSDAIFPTGLFVSTAGGAPAAVVLTESDHGQAGPHAPGEAGTTALSTSPYGGRWLSVGGLNPNINNAFSISDNNLVIFQASFLDLGTQSDLQTGQSYTYQKNVADSGIFARPNSGGNIVQIARTRQDIGPILVGPNATQPYSVLYPTGIYPSSYPPAYAGQPVHYVTFNDFVAQNKTGWVAFASGLAPGLGGGVFMAAPNNGTGSSYSVRAVALSGNPAPGAGPGVTYGTFTNVALALNNHNNQFSDPNLPPEVGFLATLAGTSVITGFNDVGLFLANGHLTSNQFVRETAMLARTGEILTVGPGKSEIIQGFGATNSGAAGPLSSIGNGRNGINDFGQLAIDVSFRDGTTGVYVFTPDLHLRDSNASGTGTAGPTLTTTWNNTTGWTFGYNPADAIYKVVIDPGDASDKSAIPLAPITDVTVTGLGTQTLPGLKVGGVTGRSHLQVNGNAVVTLGVRGITDGSEILTLQSGTGGLGVSDITGANVTFRLNGDVRSLAGATTAAVGVGVDLGNVPAVTIPATPLTPLPPSTADIDRFRTFNVDRGNFVGANPIDLVVSGVISSPSETYTAPDGTLVTNDIHRGLWKTGPGTLQLTGINTFGPDVTKNTQVITPVGGTATTVTDPYIASPFLESLRITGGEVSVGGDANLGLAPGAVSPTNAYRVRWIVLNGGGLQSTGTFTLDSSRGIGLGPTSGFGTGTFDVTGANVLGYAGAIADNTDGVTTGVGTLDKTGLGTLALTGINTYRGGTIVDQGTLLVSSDSALGAAGSPVTVNIAGRLVYNGTTVTTRPFTLNGGILSVNPGQNLVLSNTMVVGGHLAGAGTMTLNGTNTLLNTSIEGNVATAAGTTNVATLQSTVVQGSGTLTVGPSSHVNVADFQSYGLVNVAPAPAGSGQLTLLKNTGFTPMYFNAGSRTFIATPANDGGPFVAAVDLNGKNAIVAGGLFVNNGFVGDSSGQGGSVIADYGALVKGGGTYQSAVITQNGGKFQVGNSPGISRAESLILGPGGTSSFNWQINNATGQAGPTADANNQVSGWSLLSVEKLIDPFTGQLSSGDLTWSATSVAGTQFNMSLQTLINPITVGQDTQGAMANFNPTQDYAWKFVSWQGNYTGPTTDAALTSTVLFDASTFVNPTDPAGKFSLHFDGTNKEIDVIYSVPEPGSMAFVGLGGLAAGWAARRRRIARRS
jgi:autotransporter-associated beta strand protein